MTDLATYPESEFTPGRFRRSDRQRVARTVTAVKALVRAGRVNEAIDLARRTLASDDAPPVLVAQLRSTLCPILVANGHPSEAVEEAEAVLREPGLPVGMYRAMELGRILALIAEDNMAKARRLAEGLLGRADPSGGHQALAGALTALAFIAWEDGRVIDGIGLMKAAVCRADNGPERTRPFHPRFNLAAMLAAVGEFEEAEHCIHEGRQEVERSGDTLWAAAPAVFAGRVHLAAGAFDEARAEAEAGLSTADHLGTRLFVPMALSLLAFLALVTGDVKEAASLIGRAQSEPHPNGTDFASTAQVYVRARIAEAQGGAALAAGVLVPVTSDLTAHARLFIEDPSAAPWLVGISDANGDRRTAERVVIHAERLAADNRGIIPIAVAATHARGLYEGDADLVKQAASEHRHPLAAAMAHEGAGCILANGDGDAAHAEFHLALQGYEQLGAVRDAARATTQLRHGNVGKGASGRTKRPVTGWPSLTDTERTVAQLVAEAMTNASIAERMYLSRHTVDFHLRQIFRKLNIRSRVALARMALEHA
jgi:DNA-binding CsgD family transcriptional regulator